MRRILATLVILALSASFAHATNRMTPPRNATRRPAPLTTKLWSYKPRVHRAEKTRRPEIHEHTTPRPLVPVHISGHRPAVQKVKSRRPLIYATDPGSQFPTPEDPK